MPKRPSDRVTQAQPKNRTKGQQTAQVRRLPVAPFRSRGVLLQLVRDLPLSGTTRALLLEMAGLARMPSTSDPVCWGTHDYWAARLSCSARTILRAVRRLQTKGLINVRHRGRKGGGRTASTYYLQSAMIRAMAHGGTRGQQPKKRKPGAAWKQITKPQLAALEKNEAIDGSLKQKQWLWKKLLIAHGISDGTDKWQNLYGVLWMNYWRDPKNSWSGDLHRRVINQAAKNGDFRRWAFVLARTRDQAEEYVNK